MRREVREVLPRLRHLRPQAFSFRWGETEYGIGILPLGGYVKMLGQEDNPAKAAEEAASQARRPPRRHLPKGSHRRDEHLDPRSYLAKTVPKRMAIISAGVIMNVIFAFAVAVGLQIGVKENPCVVGRLLPGEPAWTAGLRTGDEIVRIGDIENPRFRDLQQGVLLGTISTGREVRRPRPELKNTIARDIPADFSRGAPMIGVTSPSSTVLAHPPLDPVWEKRWKKKYTPAKKSRP